MQAILSELPTDTWLNVLANVDSFTGFKYIRIDDLYFMHVTHLKEHEFMSDSDWKDTFEEHVFEVLRSKTFALKKPHHFGSPFISAYQIAVEFEVQFPDVVDKYNKGVGSGYDGMHNLAAYIARSLSQNIKNNPNYAVEGAWLSANGLDDLAYLHKNSTKSGSSNTEYGAFSMYRMK